MKIREDKIYTKARKRLNTVSSDAVLSWALQAQDAMQQALEFYGRDDDPAALEEAEMGAYATLASIHILKERSRT
jgi:hypothetical protein